MENNIKILTNICKNKKMYNKMSVISWVTDSNHPEISEKMDSILQDLYEAKAYNSNCVNIGNGRKKYTYQYDGQLTERTREKIDEIRFVPLIIKWKPVYNKNDYEINAISRGIISILKPLITKITCNNINTISVKFEDEHFYYEPKVYKEINYRNDDIGYPLYYHPNDIQKVIDHIDLDSFIGYELLSENLACMDVIEDNMPQVVNYLKVISAAPFNKLLNYESVIVVNRIPLDDDTRISILYDEWRSLIDDFNTNTDKNYFILDIDSVSNDLVDELASLWNFKLVNPEHRVFKNNTYNTKNLNDLFLTKSWLEESVKNILLGSLPSVTFPIPNILNTSTSYSVDGLKPNIITELNQMNGLSAAQNLINSNNIGGLNNGINGINNLLNVSNNNSVNFTNSDNLNNGYGNDSLKSASVNDIGIYKNNNDNANGSNLNEDGNGAMNMNIDTRGSLINYNNRIAYKYAVIRAYYGLTMENQVLKPFIGSCHVNEDMTVTANFSSYSEYLTMINLLNDEISNISNWTVIPVKSQEEGIILRWAISSGKIQSTIKNKIYNPIIIDNNVIIDTNTTEEFNLTNPTTVDNDANNYAIYSVLEDDKKLNKLKTELFLELDKYYKTKCNNISTLNLDLISLLSLIVDTDSGNIENVVKDSDINKNSCYNYNFLRLKLSSLFALRPYSRKIQCDISLHHLAINGYYNIGPLRGFLEHCPLPLLVKPLYGEIVKEGSYVFSAHYKNQYYNLIEISLTEQESKQCHKILEDLWQEGIFLSPWCSCYIQHTENMSVLPFFNNQYLNSAITDPIKAKDILKYLSLLHKLI